MLIVSQDGQGSGGPKVIPCFLDETGSLKNEPLFAVGVLVVRNIDALTSRLAVASYNLNARKHEERKSLHRDLRTQKRIVNIDELNILFRDTRHHEFKFTAIRQTNLQNYKAILSLLFSVPDSEFHALIVRPDSKLLSAYRSHNWLTYVRTTYHLLSRRLVAPSFVSCDYMDQPKHMPFSLESRLGAIPNVSGCMRLASECSPCLQMVDVLLGLVAFDWREANGHTEDSITAQTRRDLVRHVKRHLRVPLDSHFLPTDRNYFRRSGGPMRFSVWETTPAFLLRALAKEKSSGHATGSIPPSGVTGSGHSPNSYERSLLSA